MRPLLLFGALVLVATAACYRAATAVAPEPVAPAVLLLSEELRHEGPPLVTVRRNVWRREYVVTGGDATALRAALDRSGPYVAPLGGRFDAATTWGLRWSFRYRNTPGECSLAAATIELEDVIVLPDRAVASELEPGLRERWLAYRAALEAHEMEHVRLHLESALLLQEAFAGAAAAPDCTELRAALSALGEAAVRSIGANDLDLDKETGHGAAQGAVFP